MLRSFQRVPSCSTSLRSPSLHTSARPLVASAPSFLCNIRPQQTCPATTHAVSNPTLADIEKRWSVMPAQEQAELWMALRDRMKNDWHDLTFQERKASYWIAFGPHGPRARQPPQFWFHVKWVTVAIVGSCAVLALIRSQAGPAPSTMNKEWQEATNAYLKRQRVEPITGISSEGYKGKGQVQSGPKRD